MKNSEIKALALSKYPEPSPTNGSKYTNVNDATMYARRAYEQGIWAGIKLAKHKEDE